MERFNHMVGWELGFQTLELTIPELLEGGRPLWDRSCVDWTQPYRGIKWWLNVMDRFIDMVESHLMATAMAETSWMLDNPGTLMET